MSLQPRCPLPWMDLRLGFRRVYPTWLKLCFLTHLGVILERSGSPLHTFSWSECYSCTFCSALKQWRMHVLSLLDSSPFHRDYICILCLLLHLLSCYASRHRKVGYYLTRTYKCVINPVATYNKLFSIHCFNCWWITSTILYFLQAGTSHNIHMYFMISLQQNAKFHSS